MFLVLPLFCQLSGKIFCQKWSNKWFVCCGFEFAFIFTTINSQYDSTQVNDWLVSGFGSHGFFHHAVLQEITFAGN